MCVALPRRHSVCETPHPHPKSHLFPAIAAAVHLLALFAESHSLLIALLAAATETGWEADASRLLQQSPSLMQAPAVTKSPSCVVTCRQKELWSWLPGGVQGNQYIVRCSQFVRSTIVEKHVC